MGKVKEIMTWVIMIGVIMLMASSAWTEPVPEAIFRQMVQDDTDIRECLAKIGPAQLRKVLQAHRISLRQGGSADFIVEPTENPDGCSLCGARRCTQWIYGQIEGRYRLLLTAYAADEIVPLNRFTRGFRDLKVIYPAGNNYPASYQIYSFNGIKYQEKGKLRDMR